MWRTAQCVENHAIQRESWEEQNQILGQDPWEYGLTTANRKNLETLIRYSKMAGLISNIDKVDDFYMDVMLDSRGRGEWVGHFK